MALLASGVAAATLGGADWFPWAVPATLGRLAGVSAVPAIRLTIVGVTGAVGVTATAIWWRRADH